MASKNRLFFQTFTLFFRHDARYPFLFFLLILTLITGLSVTNDKLSFDQIELHEILTNKIIIQNKGSNLMSNGCELIMKE